MESPVAGGAFASEMPEGVASKLKPEQLALWHKLAIDKKSTPSQLRAMMRAFGHDLANAEEIVAARDKGLGVNKDIDYRLRKIPKNADGAVGAAARGVTDPVNFLDEAGAIVDTFGGTSGRENIWNSDRSFLDVLYGNIDQNRSIIQADERDHFGARLGGQLASGLLIPIGAGPRTVAALAKWGAAEGAVAGLGAGEGNLLQRLPNAAVGAGLGVATGYSLGRVGEAVSPYITRALRSRGPDADVEAPKPDDAGSAPGTQLDDLPSSGSAPGHELEVGPHGPIHRNLAGDYRGALARLQADQSGEVPGAFRHPEIGDIDLVWGDPQRYGLAKILARHPEVVDDLPEIVERLPVLWRPQDTGNNR